MLMRMMAQCGDNTKTILNITINFGQEFDCGRGCAKYRKGLLVKQKKKVAERGKA